MKKTNIILLLTLLLLPLFSAQGEIQNEIVEIRPGSVSSPISYYQKNDHLTINYTTPLLSLNTGGYGWFSEDKVTEVKTQCTLYIEYEKESIYIKTFEVEDRNITGHDVLLNPLNYTYTTVATVGQLLGLDENDSTKHIQFRVTLLFHIDCKFKKGHDHGKDLQYHTNFNMYTCNGGEITVDESIMPNIAPENASPIYALYNANSNIQYAIISKKNPNIFDLSTDEWLTWSINSEAEELTKMSTIVSNKTAGYDKYLRYSQFLDRNNTITSNSNRYVYRTYSNKEFSCHSNTIKIQAIDTLSLEGFNDNELVQFICPEIGKKTNDEYDEYKPETFTIKGKAIDWDRIKTPKSVYQIEYGWEHQSSVNSTWTLITDNLNSDTNLPDLIWENSKIKPGTESRFRQVVFIRNFGNRKVYANGDNNYVTIRPYQPIFSGNFATSEYPQICQNTLIADSISIFFVPSNGKVYKSIENGALYNDKYTFKFSASSEEESFNKTIVDDHFSIPFILQAEKDINTIITVEDGCKNKLEFPITLKISEQPQLAKNSIEVEGGSANYNGDNNILRIQAPEGQNITIRIGDNDPQKSSCRYFITYRSNQKGEDGEFLWTERSSINAVFGHTIPSYITTNEWYKSKDDYIKIEKENIITGCVSEPVYVDINYLSDIFNNRIEFEHNPNVESIYSCSSNSNPAMVGEFVSGGYGDSTYSYVWQYSNDTVNWINMCNQAGATLSTSSIEENIWNRTIGKTYYFRRMATSINKGASESSAIKSFSNILCVKPYTKPILNIQAEDSTDDFFVCHNTPVHLSQSYENANVLEEEAYKFHPFYAYKNTRGEIHPFDNDNHSLNITKDTILYAATEFCGDTIYSAEGIKITSGENLSFRSEDVTYGNCKVRGSMVEIRLNTQADYEYGIIIDQDTLMGNVHKVELPLMGSFSYQVLKRKGDCQKTTNLKINQEETTEPLAHSKLEATSDGFSIKDNTYHVCYGNVVNIFSSNEKTDNDISYVWRANGTTLNPKYTANTLSSSDFNHPDNLYTVVRTANLYVNGNFCQSVDDTILIKTYPIISVVKLKTDRDSICYGESVSLHFDEKEVYGGSGEYKYSWSMTPIDTTINIGESSKPNFTSPALTKTAFFSVSISDKNCTHHAYTNTSVSKNVYVEKDLTFSLSASPSTINAQELNDGNSVAINILSEEILISDKINCWLNGKKVKSNENFLGGVNYSLTSDLFIDNIATFSIEHIGPKLKSCKSTEQIDILLNEGFDGVPIILSSSSSSDQTTSCIGDSITLSINEDQLPKYDNKTIPASKFTYQWYKKGRESWSTCGSTSSIKVIINNDETQEYRCKLSFTPTGGVKQSTISDIHVVQGISSVKVNSISFMNESSTSKILYVCKGESGLVTLSADSVITGAKDYQWLQRVGEGEWEPVPSQRGTVGTDAPLCSVDLENYNNNTSFKLVCTNHCGVESESDNQIQLLFNAGATLSENDIVLTSNNIFDELTLPDITLCIPKDYNNTYYWSCDPSFTSSSWTPGNPVTLNNSGKGFGAGENTVYIYMVSNGKGNCASDTIAYHFNVFEKLKAGTIGFTRVEDTLCSKNGMMTISVGEIAGGDGDYQVDWMYKSGKMTNFSVIHEGTNLPFEYLDVVNGTNAAGGYSLLNVRNLTETCEFYAIISCKGEYNGRSYSTNSNRKSVYSPLKSGRIDQQTKLLCYNDALAVIKGEDAEGGDRHYSYQWYRSFDKQKWEAINEQSEVSFVGQISQDIYKLKQSAYFCRVVTDGCGQRDTSEIKTIQVKSEVLAENDDILYTPLVPRGDKAKMWGVVNDYNYVWFDRNRQIIDTTEVREIFATDNVDESSRTYYAKVLYDGCLSSNYDTIKIAAYDIDGGHLSFDNFVPNSIDDKYWICSGADAGKISADGGGNLSYRWFYTINGTESSRAYTLYSANNTSLPVTSSSVLLDTCNLKTVLTNATGIQLEKKISFYRVSYFTINDEEQTETSDTISLYITPTLGLSASILLDGSESLAGTIKAEKEVYCAGESGALIDGTLSPSSALYDLWSNSAFGPYLYDKEAADFQTWFEYGKNGKWEKAETHYGLADYAQFFNLPEIDTTYNVRRAFSDGCSTTYSNTIKQNLSDKTPSLNKVVIKATTPEGKSITEGIEMGDVLSINYTELGYNCYWFANESCTDTIVANNQLVVFDPITEKTPTTIYLKRRDNSENGCFSSALAIPLNFSTKSNGGFIYKDQLTCRNGNFKTITSGKPASGISFAPTSGVPRNFSYQWQISIDENASIWTNISDATSPDSLSEVVINQLIKEDASTYRIRRTATTESGRECYSDTVTLLLYKTLQPGIISLENIEADNVSFCQSDSLPFVTSTLPTGGYYGHVGIDGYSYGWEISINNEEYKPLSIPSPFNNRRLDLEYSVHYNSDLGIDITKDNIIHIRAHYVDECEEVYSQPISFMLWAETKNPSLYQDKDSCNSDALTIKAYDTQHYTYTWVVFDDNHQITWSYTQDSLKLQRVSELSVTEYGVVGIHKNSGCRSNFTYFNIDSLPSLKQAPLVAPKPICYNTAIEIAGGTISGGNGQKRFLWEYSYDNETFFKLDTTENLSTSPLKRSFFVRRIVFDACAADTSNSVLIKVHKKLETHISDFAINKKPCEGEMFTITFNLLKLDSLQNLEYTLGMEECSWLIKDQSVDSLRIYAHDDRNTSYMADGFEGTFKNYSILFMAKDSFQNYCYSDVILFPVSNISPLDSSRNTITCDNLHPCNGSIVTIAGSIPNKNEEDGKDISFEWYQSTDNKEWMRLSGQTNRDLTLIVQDTMYVKRVVSNHCESNESNIILLRGKETNHLDYAKALNLSITTYVDEKSDSVTLTIRDHSVEDDYSILGDGTLPTLQYGTTQLPYSASKYENNGLYIQNNAGCYGSYSIKPIRGGRIYSEGEITICQGAEVPTFKVTEVEGGNEEYAFQWQYRDEFIKEYVNIAGATTANYTPNPVNTKTWFRRVTTSDEYQSYSNEVSLSISELPKLGTLHFAGDSSFFTERELILSSSLIECTPDMKIRLADSVFYANKVSWEYHSGDERWNTLKASVSNDSVGRDFSNFELNYHLRLIAENACGADTSNIIQLTTIDVPEILDEEIFLKNLTCKGDSLDIICRFKTEDGYFINSEYEYAYSNDANLSMSYNTISHTSYYQNERTNNHILIKNVQEPFNITITRYSKRTDAKTTKTIHIPLKEVKADFTFTVNKHTYDTKEESVFIEPGDLVEFNNTSIGDVASFHWHLLDGMNTPKQVPSYGLDSYLENPDCYFYNKGTYNITLTITDSNGCQSSISCNAITIPNGSTYSSFTNQTHFLGPEEKEVMNHPLRPTVYPTHFSHSIHIQWEKQTFMYSLMDETGRYLLSGEAEDEAILQTENMPHGNYLLIVNGWSIKLIK